MISPDLRVKVFLTRNIIDLRVRTDNQGLSEGKIILDSAQNLVVEYVEEWMTCLKLMKVLMSLMGIT